LTTQLPVECAICGGRDHRVIHRPRLSPGPVVKCRRCGLVYVSPVVHVERLAAGAPGGEGALLDAAEPPGYRERYLAEAPIKRRVYDQLLARLEHAVPGGGALLDVGAYMGLFMQAATQRGWRCAGIEPDRDAWRHAAETLKLDVRCGTLETCPCEPGSFDAVTLLQVLEHVGDPRQELLRIRSLLRLGGVLLVEVPDIACWPARLLGGRHRHFARHHFTFFSPRTLAALLATCGYELIETWHPARLISVSLFEFALRSWHPAWHRAVRSALGKPWLANRTIRVNLGEVLAVLARRAPGA
jgi:2-polyprenyl-3-methyl-5-hydroxy-6-metoxy-1,4-benzoquinol methylase